VLANTRYDAHELKRAGRESGIRWRGNRTDVSFRMGQAMARRLYSRDDPRRVPYEKNESVSSDVSALVATRDLLIRLPGRVIGFAGDLTEDEARHASEGLLPLPDASVPGDLSPRLEAIAAPPPKAETEDVGVPKLTQVYLAYFRDSVTWTDARRPAFLVADHVLGGHFYSRLYVALRHEAGDTYGVGTRDRGDIVPGAYFASTFTRTDNAATIEAKLRTVFDVFHERGITEEERAGAIAYLRGSRALDRQSAAQILGRYMTERRMGLAPGFLDEQIERAALLSLDDINAMIRDFYDPARFVMLRVVPD
jgi:predicted Zn-dependent peptidase